MNLTAKQYYSSFARASDSDLRAAMPPSASSCSSSFTSSASSSTCSSPPPRPIGGKQKLHRFGSQCQQRCRRQHVEQQYLSHKRPFKATATATATATAMRSPMPASVSPSQTPTATATPTTHSASSMSKSTESSTGVRRSSIYRGVHLPRPKTGKWVAKIGHNRRTVYIGSYDSEFDAACAYDAYAIKLKGRGATLNFPRHQCRQEFRQCPKSCCRSSLAGDDVSIPPTDAVLLTKPLVWL